MTDQHDGFNSRLELDSGTINALRTLGRQMSATSDVPAAGQLWRAAWADVSTLVIVVSIEGAWALVAPVTVDIGYADRFTGILRSNASPLPVPVAVFAGLTLPVPLVTLDSGIGSIDAETLADIRALGSANLHGQPASVGIETGSSDVDAVDIRREFRVELSNSLAQLAMADLSVLAESSDFDLARELRACNLGLSDVKRILSVDLAAARQIATGTQQLTLEQAEQLSPALHCTAAELINIGLALDPDLIAVLQDPYEFGVVRLIARRDDLSEIAAARSIPAAIAARSTTQHDDGAGVRFWRDALAMLRERLSNGD